MRFARLCSLMRISKGGDQELLKLQLELELTHTQMAQKPMPREEVYVHALRASQHAKRAEVWVCVYMSTARKLGPTHKRMEGRAPVRDSEFTTKAATLQGGGG
jgi:hypothetical protein